MVIKFLVVPDKRLKGKEWLGKDFKFRFVSPVPVLFTRYIFLVVWAGAVACPAFATRYLPIWLTTACYGKRRTQVVERKKRNATVNTNVRICLDEHMGGKQPQKRENSGTHQKKLHTYFLFFFYKSRVCFIGRKLQTRFVGNHIFHLRAKNTFLKENCLKRFCFLWLPWARSTLRKIFKGTMKAI